MTRSWLPEEIIDIEFDETRTHRFLLNCTWDKSLEKALFIMLNPSWADESVCDDTVNKCIYYAKKKNCGSIEIVNLFSLITPNPERLLTAEVNNHPENDYYLYQTINNSDYIVAAWGEQGVWFNACYKVFSIIESLNKNLYCIETNRYGLPRHSGRLSKSLDIKPYSIYTGSTREKI